LLITTQQAIKLVARSANPGTARSGSKIKIENTPDRGRSGYPKKCAEQLPLLYFCL